MFVCSKNKSPTKIIRIVANVSFIVEGVDFVIAHRNDSYERNKNINPKTKDDETVHNEYQVVSVFLLQIKLAIKSVKLPIIKMTLRPTFLLNDFIVAEFSFTVSVFLKLELTFYR